MLQTVFYHMRPARPDVWVCACVILVLWMSFCSRSLAYLFCIFLHSFHHVWWRFEVQLKSSSPRMCQFKMSTFHGHAVALFFITLSFLGDSVKLYCWKCPYGDDDRGLEYRTRCFLYIIMLFFWYVSLIFSCFGHFRETLRHGFIMFNDTFLAGRAQCSTVDASWPDSFTTVPSGTRRVLDPRSLRIACRYHSKIHETAKRVMLNGPANDDELAVCFAGRGAPDLHEGCLLPTLQRVRTPFRASCGAILLCFAVSGCEFTTEWPSLHPGQRKAKLVGQQGSEQSERAFDWNSRLDADSAAWVIFQRTHLHFVRSELVRPNL